MKTTLKLSSFEPPTMPKLSKLFYNDLVKRIGKESFIAVLQPDPEIFIRKGVKGASPFYTTVKAVPENIAKKARCVHFKYHLVPKDHFRRFCLARSFFYNDNTIDYVATLKDSCIKVSFDILFKTCPDAALVDFEAVGGVSVLDKFVDYYTELNEEARELCTCGFCLNYNTCTVKSKQPNKVCCAKFTRTAAK